MKPAMPPLPPVMPPESPLAAHARDERLDAVGAARRRDGRQDVAVDDGLHARALDVHDRRFAGDRHRLFEAADAEVGVDRGHEVAGELDAVALDGVKPGSVNVTV